MKQKVLVLFSIITSVLSAAVGFLQKFVKTLDEIDHMVIFFSGIFILTVIIFLVYFLIREVIRKFYEDKLEKENSSNKKKSKKSKKKK